jgi:FKBP-type peptidyl-prolyl cis-trans isomerase SlyD
MRRAQWYPSRLCNARPAGQALFLVRAGVCAPALHTGLHMSITRDQVVSIHYTLKNDAGEVLDHSADGEPLTYLHGHGNLIPGLERELAGKNAGDKLQVTIAPADAYGEYDPQLVQRVARRSLKGLADIRIGMRLQAQSGHGARAVTVTQIAGDMVTLDGNHPLAGNTLHFEVEVAEVRAATEAELSHGHVHGPGGHHH